MRNSYSEEVIICRVLIVLAHGQKTRVSHIDSYTPVFFDKDTVDSAIDDMKDVVELKTISRDDVYKAVYSAKITAYRPQ